MSDSNEASTSTVRVAVDPILKAKWEEQRSKIVEAQRGGTEAFVALWRSAVEVVEAQPPLYLAGGYATAKAFITEFLKIPERTAARNMDIVRAASRTEIERYGPTKIDAAMSLLKKTSQSPNDLKLEIERNGKKMRVGLEAATLDEVRRVAASQNPKPRPKRETAGTMLTKLLVDRKVKGVSVIVSRSGISFRGLQLAQLRDLVDALSRAKLPITEPELKRAA